MECQSSLNCENIVHFDHCVILNESSQSSIYIDTPLTQKEMYLDVF